MATYTSTVFSKKFRTAVSVWSVPRWQKAVSLVMQVRNICMSDGSSICAPVWMPAFMSIWFSLHDFANCGFSMYQNLNATNFQWYDFPKDGWMLIEAPSYRTLLAFAGKLLKKFIWIVCMFQIVLMFFEIFFHFQFCTTDNKKSREKTPINIKLKSNKCHLVLFDFQTSSRSIGFS